MSDVRDLTLTADAARDLTGTDNVALCYRLIGDVQRTLWMPAGLNEKEMEERIEAAMAAVMGIKPRSELEGMLAVQIVATHDAAIECLRRAALSGQTFEGRQANLKNADKLMSLYLRQVDALDKHRGKGAQTMTVEHVHVESGGQAVVGVVQNDTQPSRLSRRTEQRTISHHQLSETPRPSGQTTPSRVRVKRR
jgi:hypothetical protein